MKALFLGLGGVGQRHLRNLLSVMPDAQLGAVRHTDRAFEIGFDLQPDYSVDIMEKYGIARFSSLEEGVAWQPDCAIIASPTSAHMDQTTALVRAGVPVFLEKPVSADSEGLDELLALMEEKHTPVMVGYMFRFHPGVQRFMDLVEEQAAGRMHSMHVQLNSYMPSWHSYEKYNEFYAGRKDLGGGAVLSEIHELDLVAAMFGRPEKVFASGGKLSSLDMDVEDTVCSLMEYRLDGRPFPVTLQMSFVQRPPVRTITIHAENGFVRWDGMRSLVTVEHVEQGTRKEDFSSFDRNEMFVEEIRHFVDCVRSGAEPKTNLSRVVEGHRLALEIRNCVGID
ncbi:Gfo/Idh/MocA family protein [Salidesulfovibrio onnuriiensis]|uniref:Gfo/Idh/MocA family protein n=1 Tax=Salidesulfovibrio onnuriiensis TaxID=2583823 RepID=UPI0011CC8145|nr:Gfo/Idh/MocA family oxidoreductase [Salidesulfovibrio onnuriiensis]